MKYLCLCYYDIDTCANLTPEEAQKIGPACKPHDEILKATGRLLVNASLSAPETWSYFVPKAGQPRYVSGRYLPSPHQAGAFFIVDAETEEAALQVASKHAAANYGENLGFAVEVRACDSYDAYTVADSRQSSESSSGAHNED
jgi:hypothetical protein